MGAPKQKWTSEEEAALKAGVIKHGPGKWRTILKDPEFSSILYLRSNVDLKDKWRNLSVMAHGFGSRDRDRDRDRDRVVLKRSEPLLKHDEDSMALSTVVEEFDDDMVDVKPLAIPRESLQLTGQKRSAPRLESLILEAITALREPSGSNKTTIAAYIEDQYWPPPDFQRLLSEKLKAMVATGKLIKVNRKYRIVPRSSFSGRSSKIMLMEGWQRQYGPLDRNGFKDLTKSHIDAELSRMRTMSADEAAAAAAHAVAEAEAAMLEAEEAAREAEAAEAEAEAAQAFAESAMLTLKNRNVSKMYR